VAGEERCFAAAIFGEPRAILKMGGEKKKKKLELILGHVFCKKRRPREKNMAPEKKKRPPSAGHGELGPTQRVKKQRESSGN